MPKASATPDHPLRIVVICGSTATGKTKLAVSLARRFNGEIINADSRQMYAGLTVISGKDTEPGSIPADRKTRIFRGKKFPLVTYEINAVPIWLYDITQVGNALSVSHFVFLASSVIEDITRRGKLPILVGGTGFYLSSLLGNVGTLQVPQNKQLREKLAKMTVTSLQQMLATGDIVRWRHMNVSDRNNPRRLIRAIEVAEWKKNHKLRVTRQGLCDAFWAGLSLGDEALSQRIRDRVDKRYATGALQEAQSLQYLAHDLPAMSAIGLPILIRENSGEISHEDARSLWVRKELQYAKRQKTWFLRQEEIRWYDALDDSLDTRVEKDVRQWYTGRVKDYAD